MSTTTCIVIMAVCLMLSAYFSATETAFSSANTTRLKTLAEKGNKRAALVCKLLERYDRLLSTILIGNNIVNIATASIGTVLFVKHYGDAGATISTVVVTVVVLIFGEISPKEHRQGLRRDLGHVLRADPAGPYLGLHAAQRRLLPLEKAAGEGLPPQLRQ